MDPRYRETWGDPGYPQRRSRPHVSGEERRRAATVCKALLPPASPGAISTNCPNPPATDDGWCEEHRP